MVTHQPGALLRIPWFCRILMVSSNENMSLWASKRLRQMLTYNEYVKCSFKIMPRCSTVEALGASSMALRAVGAQDGGIKKGIKDGEGDDEASGGWGAEASDFFQLSRYDTTKHPPTAC